MKIFNADLSAVLFVLLGMFVVFGNIMCDVAWERGKRKIAIGMFCLTFIMAVCFLITIIFGAVNWGW